MRMYVDETQISKMHDQLYQCCKLLQEQSDYLEHLSVDTLHSNYRMYEKIKDLNARLRIQVYTVLKGIRLIGI